MKYINIPLLAKKIYETMGIFLLSWKNGALVYMLLRKSANNGFNGLLEG